jgi:hypothetical protein
MPRRLYRAMNMGNTKSTSTTVEQQWTTYTGDGYITPPEDEANSHVSSAEEAESDSEIVEKNSTISESLPAPIKEPPRKEVTHKRYQSKVV